MCLRYCVRVCVYLCARQKLDMIGEALETSHFKGEIVFLTCTMGSMVIIVI